MKHTTAGRIDTHAHFLPPEYRSAAQAVFPDGPDGMPGFPSWNAEQALQTMDLLGVATAILSVSSPGVHFGDDTAARALAREVNETGSELMQSHPGRFGLFASLPLPDVDGTLVEIDYAFDVLNADGVVLMSNAHGRYLGDALFDPVFEELNRRGAVVFMHPTSPYCPTCHGSGLDYPAPMLEFMFDTTRAVTNLIHSGTLARFPDLRVIVPHAGAALPVLAQRIAAFGQREEVFARIRELYFDLAGFPLPSMFPVLAEVADPSRIFYGSDWPFTPASVAERLAAQLDNTDLIDQAWRAMIYRDNALELFPRLQAQAY